MPDKYMIVEVLSHHQDKIDKYYIRYIGEKKKTADEKYNELKDIISNKLLLIKRNNIPYPPLYF